MTKCEEIKGYSRKTVVGLIMAPAHYNCVRGGGEYHYCNNCLISSVVKS